MCEYITIRVFVYFAKSGHRWLKAHRWRTDGRAISSGSVAVAVTILFTTTLLGSKTIRQTKHMIVWTDGQTGGWRTDRWTTVMMAWWQLTYSLPQLSLDSKTIRHTKYTIVWTSFISWSDPAPCVTNGVCSRERAKVMAKRGSMVESLGDQNFEIWCKTSCNLPCMHQ
jgi:hypothetical protein